MKPPPTAWSSALRSAGLTLAGASTFPLATVLVAVTTQSVAQSIQTAICGAVLLGVAVLALVICMAFAAQEGGASEPSGCTWMAGAAIGVFVQGLLAVTIAAAWASGQERRARPSAPRQDRPADHRRFPTPRKGG